MKIAINGFGRIGRASFKILIEKQKKGEDVEIVAVNDLVPADALAYLLRYDSVYGIYERPVSSEENKLVVDGIKIPVFASKEPSELPWRDLGVDVVIECTGHFTKSEDAQKHIDAGAKKVVLSAPAKDEGFKTIVIGAQEISEVNSSASSTTLISNASCTTNCVTPVIRVLSQVFGIEKAMLTTVHAMTASQGLVDSPNPKDLREGRSAPQNIVPTSTGAAKATAKAFKEVEGIFDGISIRVPVICGSISDVTALLKRDTTPEEINNAFKEAQSKPEYQGVLRYTDEPIVSSDIIKSSYSAIIDGQMTRVVAGNLVKVLAWYDNEWGYSTRLVEMSILAGTQVKSFQSSPFEIG